MEDFIRVMDENPSWRDAVRARVLTRDLLELPERFAEYARQNNARLDALERELQLIREEVAVLRAHVAALEAHVAALERRIGRYEQDMGYFRARHAAETARSQRSTVAGSLGCDLVKTLSMDDLAHMVREADTSGIPANELISFRRADLVMKTVRMDTGATCYVAVEISFTVNGRDTSRAIRNAEFLRRFTDEDALAAVSGVRKDYRVDADIAANNVAWYQLDEEDLGSE